MSTNLQDWVELLNAEQHVQVDKLKEHARHGVAAKVRGEVWLYLLEVLSEDKTSEITSLLSLNTKYQGLKYDLPSELTANLLKIALRHHTKRFKNETYAGLITSLTSTNNQSKSSLNANEKGKNRLTAGVSGGGGGGTNSQKSSPMIMSIERNAPPSFSLGGNMNLNDDKHDHHHYYRDEIDQTQNQNQNQNILIDSNTHNMEDEEHDLNTIRSQLSRILPPPPTKPPSRHHYLSILEEVLGKYHNVKISNNKDNDNVGEKEEEEEKRITYNELMENYENDWIYLVTPFICVLSRPVGIFLGFQKLMERLKKFPSIPSRLASFLSLFRIALPELHSYCEDEQVPYVEVAMSWMTSLLSREMWLGDILRLWDAYLASDDMFALHCYVCVAILATCKETLEELDGSEAKLMLLDLPPLDVDRLLQDAANLRVSFPLPRPVDEDI
ncbi:uncharacterized protein L201_004227 [Kwoniella dendrophila CBS 6074]|uniref:Rab-GAP TBC domain-containing protein n=1 Tax=Kwoniella dendrophila CBS 6074 TaxID=1295534 RepID=A0AAX4JV51_9TREE